MPQSTAERREILNREDAKDAKPSDGNPFFALFASSWFSGRLHTSGSHAVSGCVFHAGADDLRTGSWAEGGP